MNLFLGLYFVVTTFIFECFSYVVVTNQVGYHYIILVIYISTLFLFSLFVINYLKNKIITGNKFKQYKDPKAIKFITTIFVALFSIILKMLEINISKEKYLFIISIILGIFSLFFLFGINFILKYYCYKIIEKHNLRPPDD